MGDGEDWVHIFCVLFGCFWAWWLHIIMVVVEGSSLVAIIAHMISLGVDVWSGGCVIPTPVHLEDYVVTFL